MKFWPMETHIVKVLEAQFVTHDVKRFKVEKPSGFDFNSGQATHLSLNLPAWRHQLRPFSITCLREDPYLEFMIKIYKEHGGVTDMLGRTNAGAELIVHEAFGTIEYKGPGVFIAAGAGITPFVSILRDLFKKDQLEGNKLIFSNKTLSDVILKDELQTMLQNDFISLLTRENSVGFIGRRIDRNYLIDNIADFGQNFYLCGPVGFVKNITDYLMDLGATPETVVFEK